MTATSEKHAFVIAVGPSHAAQASAEREIILAALAHCFDEASFEILIIDAELVDGDYMLVPRRGEVGAAGCTLRPRPPVALCRAIDAKLAELHFLKAPTIH